MRENFDPYQYAQHLRMHWRFLAGTAGVAVAIALGASLLLPKKYTAAARILIEPPAGSDPRAATAVSPIYLESLRTYEQFATSDSLFRGALDHFHLRDRNPGRPVEAWKRSVLRVEIPRSTKVLEISATLSDAQKAHALALYLAQETVKLNREVNRQGDQELIADTERQVEAARAELGKTESAWNTLVMQQPTAGLEAEIRSAESLESEIRRALVVGGEDRNREERLRQQAAELEREIAAKNRALSERTARQQELEDRLKNSRAGYAALEGRLREARASMGYRGERLAIIDPGIVPEKPSFPNLPLNMVAALLLGLAAGVLYLSIEFGYQRQKSLALRPSLRAAGDD